MYTCKAKALSPNGCPTLDTKSSGDEGAAETAAIFACFRQEAKRLLKGAAGEAKVAEIAPGQFMDVAETSADRAGGAVGGQKHRVLRVHRVSADVVARLVVMADDGFWSANHVCTPFEVDRPFARFEVGDDFAISVPRKPNIRRHGKRFYGVEIRMSAIF